MLLDEVEESLVNGLLDLENAVLEASETPEELPKPLERLEGRVVRLDVGMTLQNVLHETEGSDLKYPAEEILVQQLLEEGLVLGLQLIRLEWSKREAE